MLRSVLVAAFSAVVAFGTLSGLSGEKSDTRAGDTQWSSVKADAAVDVVVATPGDTQWS